MASFNFILKKNNSPKHAINLEIYYSGSRVRYAIKESVNPDHWQKDRKKRNAQRMKKVSGMDEYDELNSRLDDIMVRAKKAFQKYVDKTGKEPSVHQLKELLKEEFDTTVKKDKTFMARFSEYIELCKTKVNKKTGLPLKKRRSADLLSTQRNIQKFIDSEKVAFDFENINEDMIASLRAFLYDDLGFADNTVAKTLSVIVTVLRWAKKKGYTELTEYTKDEFRVTYHSVSSVYLTNKEIEDIYLKKLPESRLKILERARDIFIIGCLVGLRYGDLSRVKQHHIYPDNTIKIVMGKTNQSVSIPMHPIVKQILDKNGGAMPDKIDLSNMNGYLKRIAKLVPSLSVEVALEKRCNGVTSIYKKMKWEMVSTHICRRSFATNAWKAGVPISHIMAITGHKSEAVFLKYVKASNDEKAEIFKKSMEEAGNWSLPLRAV